MAIQSGSVSNPIELWGLAAGKSLFVHAGVLLFGAVLICVSRPSWLARLLCFPAGIVNLLMQPLHNVRFPVVLRVVYGVGATACGYYAALAIANPSELERLLEWRTDFGLAAWGDETQWRNSIDRYGMPTLVALIATCWGTVNATLMTARDRRRVANGYDYRDDELEAYYASRSYGAKKVASNEEAAEEIEVLTELSGTDHGIQLLAPANLPRALKRWEKEWLDELGGFGFSSIGGWLRPGNDSKQVNTLSLMGCNSMVYIEAVLEGRDAKVTLSSILDDGTTIHTVEAGDSRVQRSTPTDTFIAAEGGAGPRELLSGHLAAVAGIAETERSRIVPIQREHAQRLWGSSGNGQENVELECVGAAD